MNDSRPSETKLLYYNGDGDVPILIRLNVAPDQVTLSHFKSAINLRPSYRYKFYFKTEVDNYIVKEEIVDDDSKLPVFNGNIVCYIESQGGDGSDRSGCGQRSVGRSSHSQSRSYSNKSFSHHTHSPSQSLHHHRRCEGNYSDDDDDETSSRISTSTNETSVSRYIPRHQMRTKRCRNKRSESNASSVSSVTDASSIDRYLRTVYFNLDSSNQLGISINQITSNNQNGGICVGSIMKGGVVAAEGTIQPGDLILQVNDHILSNMTSDEVVEILREATIRPGRIKLVIAKNLDSNPETYFSPREDPIQPLNMAAWVAQTEATARLNGLIEPNEGVPSSESASTSASHSSMPSSYARSEQRQLIPDAPALCLNYSSMFDIAKHAASPGSGLIVKDRKWLKIIIPNAFLGRDLVNWLFTHVRGFNRRRDAYNFAKQLMKNNHINHTVNKKFSENCYYVFDKSVSNKSSNEDLAGYSQLSFNIN